MRNEKQTSRILTAAAVLIWTFCALPASGQSIVTIAGGGTDDGKPATLVFTGYPSSLALDAAGNVYFADRYYLGHRILKVSAATGIISTIAGHGAQGFSGDGGPATLAGLAKPTGLALDAVGNIYIVDQGNYRIRKVSAATGIISTIAGNGKKGISGDGGPATAASMNEPQGVALDAAGHVYIADTNNYRVRKVDATTGIISTFAGNGTYGSSGDGGPATAASVGQPSGVALDTAGNLYIADGGNGLIRKVAAVTGIISTIAGGGDFGSSGDGGPATAAGLNTPAALALDAAGNVYIAEYSRIRKVTAVTGIISTIAGNGNLFEFSGDGGPATAASLYEPQGVALDTTGNVYIADTYNYRVRKVDATTGIISTFAGNGSVDSSGDGEPATAARLRPLGAAVDAAGNVYIATYTFILMVAAETGIISTVAGNGNNAFSGDGGPATAAALYGTNGVALDGAGNIYIADTYNNRVRKVLAATGVISTIAGNGNFPMSTSGGDGGPATLAAIYPSRVALDAAGNVYISDPGRIRKVAAGTGIISTVAGNGLPEFSGDGGPATAAGGVDGIGGVAVDASGNLYIADLNYHRVRKVAAATGIISTIAGTGNPEFSGDGGPATTAGLNGPAAVALDAAGNVYIADSWDRRIRKVAAGTGVISTIAGNGIGDYFGDGGPATTAGMAPGDVALDASGNAYIADWFNNRLRAVYSCKDHVGPFDTSYPNDGIIATGTTLNINWSKSESSFRYDVLVDTEFPPKKVVQSDVTGQGFQLSGLEPGRTYYWQVRAKGDPYCLPVERTSGLRKFTTATPCTAPSAPVIEAVTNPGPSTVLKFETVTGAAVYDFYLGSGSSPLSLVASGLTSPSFTATDLVAGTTYRWRAVAHAACNTAFSSSSLEGSFTVPGSCADPGAPELVSPSNGRGGTPTETVLKWKKVPGASGYDVLLDDAFLASGTTSIQLATTLAPGKTYRWRVVAHAGCGEKTATSEGWSFSTVSCGIPSVPASLSTSKDVAQLGSTYTLSWSPAEGLDAGGRFRVERAKSGDFTGAESFTTAEASLILTAAEKATYFHRVSTQTSCGTKSAWSAPVQVAASKAPPSLTMTNPPKATVITQPRTGLPLPKLEVEVRNTGTSDFAGYFNTSQSVPFFIMNETFFSMRAGEIRIFYLQFSGVSMTQPGQYEGVLSIQAQDPTDTTAYPQAAVSLNITSNKGEDPLPQTTAPTLLVDGKPADFLRFAPAGPGEVAPELYLDIRNSGNTPVDLAADVLPDPWINVGPKGWNSSPIPPGAGRTVKLSLERLRGESGGSFPRQTYVTFRTIDGKSSRILVEDPGPLTAGLCRGRPLLGPEETSWIVPSLVSAQGLGGVRFVSTVLLTNLGPETIQAELYYTPDVPGVDGFDCGKVLLASLTVPGNDVLALIDPVGQLFKVEGSGSLEIRSPKPGQLRITSFVDAPAAGGGSFGFQLPVFANREGVRSGRPYVVTGVNHASPYRTNLILSETSGQPSSVTVTLYDKAGTALGLTERTLRPYSKTQFSVGELAAKNPVSGGALEITANAGSAGTVAPLITVIDGRTGDASSFKGIPLAESKSAYALPSVVTSPTFNSRVEIRNNSGGVAKYKVTYLGSSGNLTSQDRTLNPRQVDVFENVLIDVFNLQPGQTSSGPLHVESEASPLSVVSRVYVETAWGSYGDAIEAYAPDDPRTTGESNRILVAEGLEGTAKGDRTRGARTNLILTEITGNPVEVEVTIWEKTQRRVAPCGKLSIKLNGYEQKQINDIFGNDGFAIGEKDRMNVLCQIKPKAGSTGRVIALATRIDNKTNDTKNLGLRP